MKSLKKMYSLLPRLFTLNRLMIIIVLGVIILRINDPWAVKEIRYNTFDSYQKISPREITSEQIILVEIDENSLKTRGQWPWPRNLLSELTEKILSQSPKALGIDILFPEPDRTSPDLVAKQHHDLPNDVKNLLASLPSNDTMLALSINNKPVVLGIAAGFGTQNSLPGPSPHNIVMIGEDIRNSIPQYSRVLRNIAPLENAARAQGISNIASDPDGIIRKIPLIYNIGGTIIPAFETEILRTAGKNNPTEILYNSSEIIEIKVSDQELKTDTAGNAWIYFSNQPTRTTISAEEVLSGKIPANFFQDRIVLLGVTAIGIADYTPSPLGQNLSGLALHAQALDSIMSGTLLSHTNVSTTIELGFFILIGLVLIWIANNYAALELTVAFAVLCWSIILISWGSFIFKKVLIDPTLPLALTLTLFLLATSAGFITEQKQRRLDAQEAAKREREKETRIRKLQNELMHTIGKSSVQKLSSSIAHEMNQPMAAICNYTNAARRLLEKDITDQETLKSVLGKILTQADRGSDILKSIREGAETGKTSTKPLDVNRIIREEVELIKDTGDAEKVQITLYCDQNLPQAQGNEIQIHQVLLNLIRNAVQAITHAEQDSKSAGGEIEITTIQNSSGMIEVSISDSGPGLSNQEKETLFKPFYTSKVQGMGLGLAICRSILEALGGTLWVEENEKGGAIFLFTLPPNDT
ncbi:CHASE2 domain-containing protein [Kiloniella sp.]|uniref:CHASE2 domain-containing protein n=1 Tax=Kiloniella sp. TaxID=1938587 RepID=UPI003B0235C1